MLRILHTADWHLGASMQGVSRQDEQALFLEWLVRFLREEPVDLLIIAGDIFDSGQPSAEAQRLYFRFLAEVARSKLGQVIILSGNHDSPKRLEAPQDILAAIDVQVLGSPDLSELSRSLLPIKRAGEIVGVVAALPFIHEYRLGIRTADLSPGEILKALEARFSQLYRELADEAEARWPGLPLLASGHLSCVEPEPGDSVVPVHQSSRVGGLSREIFDPRYCYVALGHIHRCQHLPDSPAWYSGSPIAYSRVESRSPRSLLQVEIEGEAQVRTISVPCFRQIHELKGSFYEVLKQVLAIEWSDEQLTPLVFVEVEVDRYEISLRQKLLSALEEGGGGPRIVDVRQRRLKPEADALEDAPPLREICPEEVFERLCLSRQVEIDEELRMNFLEVLEMSEERLGDHERSWKEGER